jgi:hypothetical protein
LISTAVTAAGSSRRSLMTVGTRTGEKTVEFSLVADETIAKRWLWVGVR